MITIDDFAKVEIRVGMVVKAAVVEGSEKLIREEVDFGSETRIIFSGIRKWYKPEQLVGNKYLYVTNLESRKMMGEESQGMILALDTPGGKPELVKVKKNMAVGTRVR